MTIAEGDQRYVVFLTLVVRADSPGPNSDPTLNYQIVASERELMILKVGDRIITEFKQWKIIGKDVERQILTLNQSDLVSPMEALVTGNRNVMINWAVWSLVAGATGTAITLLAGADYEDSYEVYELFQKSIAEQGFPETTIEERREWLESDTCVSYLAGDLTADFAIHQMHDLYIQSGYGERFERWQEFYELVEYGEDNFYPHQAHYPEMTQATMEENFTVEVKRVLHLEF